MRPQYLNLMANEEDGKRWVAEITGEDPTFKLKRDFQPEISSGVWEMYDGWYQIYGIVAGITPFQKEYVRVKDGKMTRRLSFRYVLEHLPEIKASEPERMERLKFQNKTLLDEIKEAVPDDMVSEEIERQKDEMDFMDSSEQLLEGLKALIKRKDGIIKEYKKVVENRPDDW